MSENIHDNKFKEELEKELESGFHKGPDNADDHDDFTVRVKREEYVVKRRFYDKDKALEEAETLRQDEGNLVEDNIEGQAFATDEEDDTVDWDQLVDAGLEFDPPIAHAAEKPPGEPPVGLSAHSPDPEMDDKILEKTLLVKRPKKEKPKEMEMEAHEDVEFEGEEEQVDVPLKKSKSKKPLLVLVLLFLCLGGGGVYYYFTNIASKPASPARQPATVKKMDASPMPARPVAKPVTPPEPLAEKQVVAKQPVSKTPPEPVVKPPVKVAKAEPVVSNIPPAEPVTKQKPPVPVQKIVTVEDHFTHTVHVSSYRKREQAMTAVTQLTKKGFDAYTGTISIPGKGEWHRVYAGYLKDLDSAVALSKQIKQETREDAIARKAPTAIQVGEIAPLAQLKATLSELSKKGYGANAVPVAQGSDMGRILLGAFKKDTEAATMLSMMKKDGFDVKTVLR